MFEKIVIGCAAWLYALMGTVMAWGVLELLLSGGPGQAMLGLALIPIIIISYSMSVSLAKIIFD